MLKNVLYLSIIRHSNQKQCFIRKLTVLTYKNRTEFDDYVFQSGTSRKIYVNREKSCTIYSNQPIGNWMWKKKMVQV